MPLLEDNIFDKKTFQNFQELMGPNLKVVLLKHLEIAGKYVHTIHDSLNSSDFNAMHNAAHPLNSSSRQIGALQVANLAEEIENLSNSPAPDIKILSDLILQLQTAQSMADASIKNTII